MDLTRTQSKRARARRFALAGAGGAVLLVATVAAAWVGPALPAVERRSVWIGTVKKGVFVNSVRGSGTLVPQRSMLVAAPADARVDQVHMQPGSRVRVGDAILTLSNVNLQQEKTEAERILQAAEADLVDLPAKLRAQILQEEAAFITLQGESTRAVAQHKADEALARSGSIGVLALEEGEALTEEFRRRLQLERDRLNVMRRSLQAQVVAQKARVDQLRSSLQARVQALEALVVRAEFSGTLQSVSVEVGQHVTSGLPLARIADAERLNAELRVPETLAKDLQKGQIVTLDARLGRAKGHVARIDPGAKEGTVLVAVELDGGLPPGARPDLQVDGDIQLSQRPDTIFVERPVNAESNATVDVFKIGKDATAVRTKVQVGLTSLENVQVRGGLAVGDQIIVSDTAAFDRFDKILLR
jgi:HlyD family secretion protein